MQKPWYALLCTATAGLMMLSSPMLMRIGFIQRTAEQHLKIRTEMVYLASLLSFKARNHL